MRKGFTFFELLVLLAIISVVGAVVMAAVAIKWVRHVRMSCMDNLKNTGLGFGMYQGTWVHYPGAREATHTGALGPGFVREMGTITADWIFACPAEKTPPEWAGTRQYLDALSRGFNRKSDRWHAGTLGYDYDNTIPRHPEPQRAIMADKDVDQHRSGSVVLFADRHVEFVQAGPIEGAVPNDYVDDSDIYQGSPGDDTDCYLNGPDTVWE